MAELAPHSSAGIRPGSFRAWLLGARPLTLPLGVAPVVVGAALAVSQAPTGGVRIGAILAALFSAIGLQIGANFANDLYDNDRGTDSKGRLGPVRVSQAGLLTRAQVRLGMIASFVFAALFGVYLVAVGGLPILVIGIASILCAMAYTGGPYPLGYHGLGELFVLIFFGLVAVGGTAYVASGQFLPLSLPYGLVIGGLASAVLVVNNVRDREGDATSGKRTLVVRFGRGWGVAEYALTLLLAVVVPALLVLVGRASLWTALSLGAIPLGIRLLGSLKREEGVALNGVLARTGQLTFLYALLLGAGLMLGRG